MGESPHAIGIVLFPGFQALDAFGPLDALNIVARERPLSLSIIASTLEPVSTACSLPSYPTASPDFAQSIVPTHTFETAPPLHMIIVPGGIGTRDEARTERLIQFLRSRLEGRVLQYVLSVCTGSLLVARTGLFTNCEATTNKKAFDFVRERHPELNWKARARWVEGRSKWWSSSGVSAGTDMTLGWISHVWGEVEASRVERFMEWTRRGQGEDDWAAVYGL